MCVTTLLLFTRPKEYSDYAAFFLSFLYEPLCGSILDSHPGIASHGSPRRLRWKLKYFAERNLQWSRDPDLLCLDLKSVSSQRSVQPDASQHRRQLDHCAFRPG